MRFKGVPTLSFSQGLKFALVQLFARAFRLSSGLFGSFKLERVAPFSEHKMEPVFKCRAVFSLTRLAAAGPA